MRNRKWKVAVGIGAAALIAGGVVGVAGFANAENPARAAKFVDGFGKVTDDFSDHAKEVGALCDGCGNSRGTDLVLLWQSILAADGYLPGSEIDGYFGDRTAEATKEWQSDHDLDSDGRVGSKTWAAADDNMNVDSDGSVYYFGGDEELGGFLTFARDEDKGNYDLIRVGVYDDASWDDTSGSKYLYMSKASNTLVEED
ncbi:peptidoglycan-binding domain-containing protein [Stackebrandtia nassauensis]|uniref:Peptidoglycan-binding domain 1 protein n=1 Tax=Stackebrandtia nassauensis (strain DSM 44728 / CIP 108903 / NRRL B-16338 / NBRC 102104 / LLR-40K-21) TaxID=446470 RepID=D3PXG1_STANL|nr:peptidoglycan-binding domain-containing protein [Stackebrandtia nassauensis]ADD41424.1 Peptidoglycan-binding domain 1 protein [Stackebrandtia nassauensis DSM 44728]